MSLRSLGALASIALLSACFYDGEPRRRPAPDRSVPEAPSLPSADDAPSPVASSPSPMLVEVDSDQTMDANPGEGVGVFVEYSRGGHWHLWWTCDTEQTGQSCDFAVRVTAAAGSISNVDDSELPNGSVRSPTESRVDASTTTSSEVHGIRFDTNPGAVITVEASIGGLKDGSFLFFVQGGKVNGGFSGKLTNPLQLQGNAA